MRDANVNLAYGLSLLLTQFVSNISRYVQKLLSFSPAHSNNTILCFSIYSDTYLNQIDIDKSNTERFHSLQVNSQWTDNTEREEHKYNKSTTYVPLMHL